MLEVLYHHATFGGPRTSPVTGAAKNVEFLSLCLSVHLFVRHAFKCQRLCARFHHEGAGETILMPLDRGRFVVVHPHSTFSDWCQLATALNTEVQKVAKIGFFAN